MRTKRGYQRSTRKLTKDERRTIEVIINQESHDAIKLYRLKVAKDKEQSQIRKLRKMRNSRDSYDGL